MCCIFRPKKINEANLKKIYDAMEAYHRSLEIAGEKDTYFKKSDPPTELRRFQISWTNSEAFFKYTKSERFFDEDSEYFIADDGVVDGVIGVFDSKLVISFMASNSDADWKANFQFGHKSLPYPGMEGSKVRVHDGYSSHYKKVRAFLQSKTKDFLETTPKGKVLVVGHSMGGSVAQLCALDLHYNFNRQNIDIEVVSFGAPRVGNRAFKKSFERRMKGRYLNIHYANEFTEKVPFIFFGYRHAGSFCDQTRIDLKTGMYLPLWFGIKSHYFWNYIEGWLSRSELYTKFKPPLTLR